MYFNRRTFLHSGTGDENKLLKNKLKKYTFPKRRTSGGSQTHLLSVLLPVCTPVALPVLPRLNFCSWPTMVLEKKQQRNKQKNIRPALRFLLLLKKKEKKRRSFYQTLLRSIQTYG